jgi:C_GCAxxG_C_C family probable redox protein
MIDDRGCTDAAVAQRMFPNEASPMDRRDKAESLFREKTNCAQAVLLSFASENGLDESTALKIACGFGAGMARLQETCGAVTAAYMVFGLELAIGENDRDIAKEKTYAVMKQFEKRFVERHGTTSCRELLNCDLNSDDGKTAYEENALKNAVCVNCVRDSVQLVEDLLGKSHVVE